MAITVADNFSYQGKKPLDGRDTFATLAAMKAYAEASVYDGCLSYCDEDGKRYEFKSTNTVDPTTGKWREYSSGGGGQTYSDFTGATASTAGAHGLVPAPSAGDEGKVLFGNGAWGALINSPNELPVLFDERGTEYQVGWYFLSNGTKKPVYMKTVNGTLSNSASTIVAHNIANIDKICHAYGGVIDTGGYYGIIGGEDSNGDYNSGVSKTNVKIHTGSASYWSGKAFTVTVYYTKTTDTPS